MISCAREREFSLPPALASSCFSMVPVHKDVPQTSNNETHKPIVSTSTSLLYYAVDAKVGGSIGILLLLLWLLVDPRSGKTIWGCSLQVRTVVLRIFWIEKIGGGSKIDDGFLIDWRNDKPFRVIRTGIELEEMVLEIL